MKLLFKILSLRRSQEEGFVIPVIFALGLIMTLIGIISIFQSSDEEIISISQRDTSRASAAAEAGVARYREYIDSYKTIAMYSACLTGWSDTACNDPANAASWANATSGNIPNLASLCPADGKTFNDNDDDIQAIATRAWQNIGDDPSQGQYRLIDYTYNLGVFNANPPTPSYTTQPIGTLVVEGRVNQQNTDLENAINASVARISVNLPIQPGLPNTAISPNVSVAPFLNGFNPALWITGANDAGGVTRVGNLRVNGNIVLTNDNCKFGSGATLPTDANLFDSTKQSILIDPRAPVIATATQTANIPNINEITLNELKTQALPLKGDLDLAKSRSIAKTIAGDSVYYYKLVDAVTPDTSASGVNATLGNPVDLDIDGGSIINIRDGRKVILYVEGNINIRPNIAIPGDIKINQSAANTSANLEIYVTDATKNININGNGKVNIKALIHAPDSTVNIAAGSDVSFIGAMWVKNWNSFLSGNDFFNINLDNINPGVAIPAQQYDQYLNYTYVKKLIDDNTRVADPIIAAPSEWKTQETE